MSLSDLFIAYLIAQGAHTGGHFIQAQNPGNPMRDEPMRLDVRNLQEIWKNWDSNNPGHLIDRWTAAPPGSPVARAQMSHEDYLKDIDKKATDIHGAGFAWQDNIRNLIPDKETRDNVGKMSALIKGLYLTGVPQKLSRQITSTGGDIEDMKRVSGNKYVKPLVAASALADLYDVPLKFTTINGSPGLMYNMRF